MPMLVAFATSPDCKTELEAMGFRETTVMLKASGESKEDAERAFWKMKNKPYQFAVTDYWGASPD